VRAARSDPPSSLLTPHSIRLSSIILILIRSEFLPYDGYGRASSVDEGAFAVQPYEGYPLLPETAIDGFVFGTITALDPNRSAGGGYLQGPDGSRCGLQWELSESPFIMRIEGPDAERWGLYRVGFTRPVATSADLVFNLRLVLPKLKILYARARGVC
jgi:hypothetical protein